MRDTVSLSEPPVPVKKPVKEKPIDPLDIAATQEHARHVREASNSRAVALDFGARMALALDEVDRDIAAANMRKAALYGELRRRGYNVETFRYLLREAQSILCAGQRGIAAACSMPTFRCRRPIATGAPNDTTSFPISSTPGLQTGSARPEGDFRQQCFLNALPNCRRHPRTRSCRRLFCGGAMSDPAWAPMPFAVALRYLRSPTQSCAPDDPMADAFIERLILEDPPNAMRQLRMFFASPRPSVPERRQ